MKLKPRQLFGAVLALTGAIVIVITFLSHHPGKKTDAPIQVSCQTEEERRAYLTQRGYTLGEEEQCKPITIPAEFNEVYTDYNEIQKKQGFDLTPYQGKQAMLYTYRVTNYGENDRVIADLMVRDGVLIGADLCDPSADEGFLTALGDNPHGTTG